MLCYQQLHATLALTIKQAHIVFIPLQLSALCHFGLEQY